MGLAGMCDVLLATERARFAMPEVRMGLFPMIIVAHLARALPRKLLLDLMLTGRPMDAAEAHRTGFVNRVCAGTDQLWAAADEYAGWFAATSPHAVRLGRRAFTLLADLPASQALDAAQFLNLTFFLGSDLAEGAAAFLEKRSPSWMEGVDRD
jgi:enoyl-CoA hydratase/carnithine racemase